MSVRDGSITAYDRAQNRALGCCVVENGEPCPYRVFIAKWRMCRLHYGRWCSGTLDLDKGNGVVVIDRGLLESKNVVREPIFRIVAELKKNDEEKLKELEIDCCMVIEDGKVCGGQLKDKGRGLCSKHYQRDRKYGNPLVRKRGQVIVCGKRKVCEVVENGEQCGRRVESRGLCRKHYQRKMKHGDVLCVKKRGLASQISTEERRQLLVRIARGETLSSIACEKGVSRQYIWQLKERYGCEVSPKV